MATIITNIDPNTLETQNYSNQDINLIPLEQVPSQFDPFSNYVEYTIISTDGSFQITDQNFIDYRIINDYSPTNASVVYSVDINPETDLITKGFTNGEYNVIYNFLNNELNSTSDNRAFFIKEISPDRTEIKIASNILSNLDIESSYNTFKTKLNNTTYFQDFYLNFGNNSLIIANNILIDNTKPQYEILINLYEALPNQFRLKDTLWIVTQVADGLAFNVQFQPEVITPVIVNPTLKGPNFNLPLKDKINNSTNYVNYEELLTTGLATSQQQVLSYLQDKSINIGVDYSDFSDFIHFSSAESRIENFFYKVQLIEQYNADITILQSSTSSSISESVATLQAKIDNITNNFDGYEYWLYFETGSTTYPKGTTTPPYTLLSSSNATVITWYNNLIESASIFDQNNQDYLVNTIPDYLRDDPQNQPYTTFINMIGQHYDNLWLYYKDVTNRYNGDNRLEFGISKDLVADALRSFGLKIYQNNFSANDLYSAFIGYNTLPSSSTGYNITGSYVGEYPYEYISNYITSSQEALFEPADDINKEVYKRLYHNLPLLLKQKGTVAGLRNLINVYGIPDTILRISEFGGRDKDISTYDYFQEKYGKVFKINSNLDMSSEYFISEFAANPLWDTPNRRPASIQFRFKTDIIPSSSMEPLGIFQLDRGNPFLPTCSLLLTYTNSGMNTSSYSGSIIDPEYQYAKLDFIPNNSFPNNSASLYLPFFDNNWWSVMINRSGSYFEIFAGNKLNYNGYDGNEIGFIASSSITQTSQWFNSLWISFYKSRFNGNNYFFPSGSIQEIRYWSKTGSLESFKNYIMNPSSISGFSDIENSLIFRAPLGNELYTHTSSVHPKVTGSWTSTSSFGTNSNFRIGNLSIFNDTETVFLNSPIVGLRNRVTDKIQIIDQELPQINLFYTQSGNTLSQYISIEQEYLISGSETPDNNALEVAFSPQNEVDDDIIASLGYFNIGEYIGDPRQISSSATSYPDLNALAAGYFKKYYDRYDLYDYIRLIKFFDNSLFKMIKDFVPARTNLRSGVVVKQHILERNKYPQPQMTWEDVTYSSSIDTAFFSGSTGGTFNEFNVLYNVNITGSIGEAGGTVLDSNFTNIFNNIINEGVFLENGYFSSNGALVSNIQGIGNLTFSGSLSTLTLSDIFFRIVSSTNGIIYESPAFNSLAGGFSFSTGPISLIFGETLNIEGKAIGTFGGAINDIIGSAQISNINTQTWYETVIGPSGSTLYPNYDQREFYNGELPGTVIEATNGELNEANEFKYPSTLEINYDIVFYRSDITPLDSFLNINTSPNQGEIYLYYDTGSFLSYQDAGLTPAIRPR